MGTVSVCPYTPISQREIYWDARSDRETTSSQGVTYDIVDKKT